MFLFTLKEEFSVQLRYERKLHIALLANLGYPNSKSVDKEKKAQNPPPLKNEQVSCKQISIVVYKGIVGSETH